MNSSKPSKGRVPLYPNPPLSPYNPENDIFYFPPIRVQATPLGPAFSTPDRTKVTFINTHYSQGSVLIADVANRVVVMSKYNLGASAKALKMMTISVP